MNSVICTLFEGHYHLGLAGLCNSLYRNGYRGEIYAGYRGDLPIWAANAKPNIELSWNNAVTFEINDDLKLHFLPLLTPSHFANYKPNFMIELWNGPAKNAEQMFYFDPDIVVVKSWLLFEEWVSCGIALCEDVNSPLLENHPRRVAWRRFFLKKNIELKFKESIYVNSGFIGLNSENREFLQLWIKTQEQIASLTGGLNFSIFTKEDHKHLEQIGGPFMPFLTTDQDALNIAIELDDYIISFIGKTGMGFENGFTIMQHAIGNPKPWKFRVIQQLLDGKPPRNVDVEYWKHMDDPIQVYSKFKVIWKKFILQLGRGFGRFYSRN